MTHFNILIDASGSMGLFKDKDGHVDKNYLLPDGTTTRTELVKKVLINSIIPKLSFVDTIEIETFSSPLVLNDFGNPKLKAGNKQYLPKFISVYKDDFNYEIISKVINEIKTPIEAGTPLSWATCTTINCSKHEKVNILILSDGDDSENKEFDSKIIETIGSKNCKIYFIGISQNEEAQIKSKNLAEKTNGFYVNLEVMNYDETVFNNMLFEFNTTITSHALKESLKIEPTVVEPISETLENKIESNIIEVVKEDEIIEEEIIQNDIEPIELKKQVEENTKSLQLITSQLDSIVKQISFIGKEKTNNEDEFEANEDEERNRIIGYQCEKHLFTQYLKKNWKDTNWLNELEEQSKPYDFEIIIKDVKYYIECKGSVSNTEEFFLTKNEWQFYLQNRNNYRLYFVSDINSQNPTIHRIEDLLKDMEEGKLIPCSSVNRKVKADRILFQINQ
jgi:hypothetical protein